MVKLHICIVVGSFPPNCAGIGNYAYNLSKKLIEHGHKVTVFTRGVWNRSCIIEKVEGILVYRIRFIPLYPFHVELHGIFLNKIFKSLENSFDLIHIHSPLVPLVHTKLPRVVTEHGTTKGDIDNSSLKDVHSIILHFFSQKLISLDSKAIKNSNRITTVSKSCAEELRNEYGINREITVINNGVDTNYFTPKIRNVTKEPYILYTGRLDSRKGLVDLIESAKYICKKHPEIKFILTGKGANKKYLEQKIKDIELENNFYFSGFVDQLKLIEYYQYASIYVLPSYYEGLPTTLLEAMSCGLPSIATDVAGNSEVIKDGENGLLVPPKNPKKLADTINKLLDDDRLRNKIGTNARTHIVENYDWEIIADKIEEIYKSIM